jgi:hypothetical protein
MESEEMRLLEAKIQALAVVLDCFVKGFGLDRDERPNSGMR